LHAEVEEHIAPVKVLSATCAVVVVCMRPLRHGGDGIDDATSSKEDLLYARLWLPQLFLHWLCQKVFNAAFLLSVCKLILFQWK